MTIRVAFKNLDKHPRHVYVGVPLSPRPPLGNVSVDKTQKIPEAYYEDGIIRGWCETTPPMPGIINTIRFLMPEIEGLEYIFTNRRDGWWNTAFPSRESWGS